MSEFAARTIAFYLPQFHPIPENDSWWGPGFTEWTNTAAARPLFPGHRQPDLPADLGFYDLRLAETRSAQADLARQYGVEAFCYWHYWFGGGKRILERPFAEVVASGQPNFPFCLAWANQSWTGIWHGAPKHVLVEQQYLGAEDDRAHFDAILPALRDDRYLRVDGKPVFYVFRPEHLPQPAMFIDRWQEMASKSGLRGLYLVAEVSDLLGGGPKYTNVKADGFDFGVYQRLPADLNRWSRARMKVIRKSLGGPEIYPYSDRPIAWPDEIDPGIHQPTVYPNWDNTPRSKRRGLVLHGATPDRFGVQVRDAVQRLAARPAEQRLLWVKSWNEWAEGNHLEPDRRYGHGWLKALQRGLQGVDQ